MNVKEVASKPTLCIPARAVLLTHVTVHSDSQTVIFSSFSLTQRTIVPEIIAQLHTPLRTKGTTVAQRLIDRAECGLGP